MLYAKLSHHLLKKDHHYKKQFLENHAYYCQYFIRLGWAGPAGHLGQPELIGIFPKCYKSVHIRLWEVSQSHHWLQCSFILILEQCTINTW